MDFKEEHDDYNFDHLAIIEIPSSMSHNIMPICADTDPYAKHIYIAARVSNEYICVFIISESGNIEKKLNRKGLWTPLAIAIHQDNLYMTILEAPFLVHFKVADHLRLIRSKEAIRSPVDKFKHLRRLAVSNNGDVFVTDFDRHRIQILDGSLNYKRQISHYSMVNPCDVKVTPDEVFVLSLNPLHSRYCILVFNQLGFKLRSIIFRGLEYCSSENPSIFPSFCLDNGNFIINDVETDQVKFFTKDGTLFQKLGKSGTRDPGMFSFITGVTLTANHKLVVVSMFGNFEVQIFSCV